MTPRTEGPPHPARLLAWLYGGAGVTFLAIVGLSIHSGGFTAAAIALACGAASLGIARSFYVRIPAVQLVNRAAQHLTRGNIDETQALLATIGRAAARDAIILRAVANLRALIALYECRAEESENFATITIDKRLGFLTRPFVQLATAHAIRALARAARGDAAGAKADADIAESSVDATPEIIARARLVRALLASRAAYHEEAFRIYVAANARLVLEYSPPGERALFRALRRMSRTPERSVYREAARASDDRHPSKLATWIATMAPEAAAYIDGDRLLAESVEEIPTESGVPSDVRALRAARSNRRSAATPGLWRMRNVLACLAILGLSLALWWLLAPPAITPPPAAIPSPEPSPELLWLASFIIANLPVVPVVVVGALVLPLLRAMNRRRERALSIARRLAALGQRQRAKPALADLASGRNGLFAAAAGLELAKLAAQEANFAEALARCDAAIARVEKQPLRAAAADSLLPTLMAESAVAMAACGGIEEAAAELAVLAREFPAYSELATAQLRVRLLSSVREADRSTACALAKGRTASMLLPYREDVLADLVLASRGRLAEEDLSRLDGELLDDAELRAWLDAVAPGLRADRPMGGAR